eukprot:m51a1_g292 hypothetical protein (710) ;mRNA; f:348637-350766
MSIRAMNGQNVALALVLLYASAMAYQCPMAYWSFNDDILREQSGRFPLTVAYGAAGLVPGAVGRAVEAGTPISVLQTAPSRDVQIGNSSDWALMLWIRGAIVPLGDHRRVAETPVPPTKGWDWAGFSIQHNFQLPGMQLAICGNYAARGCLYLGSGKQVTDDHWHHYAASIDRATGLGTFYVDGVAQPRNASTCWSNTPTCLTNWGPRGGGDFSPMLATDIYRPEGRFALNLGFARVDEVMFFHRTLAPEEVALAANPATAAAYAAQCDARQPACYAPGRAGMENPPALLLAECRFASLDTFALSVRAPRVRTRSAVALSVGPCALDGQATEALDNCSDRVRGTRSWASLVRDCGVRLLASQGGADVYEGVLTAAFSEEAPAVHGVPVNRTATAGLPFRVRFSSAVSASTGAVRVFAPADVQASLQGVAVRLAAASRAVTLEYVTGVQEPLELALESFAVADSSQAAATAEAAPASTAPSGGFVLQRWRAALTPAAAVCSFRALGVTATFAVRCHAATPAAQCPFGRNGTAQQQRVNASFEVTTASFCGEVTDTVDVRASQLRLYRSGQFAEEAAAFALGAPVFAEATFSSSSATITAVDVVSVVARGEAVASAAGEADLVALGRVSVLPQGDASRVRLTFAASPEVFRAAQDSSSSMSVTAQFRVHYLGNARRSEPSSHTLELTSARVLLLHAAEAQASAAPSLRPWF